MLMYLVLLGGGLRALLFASGLSPSLGQAVELASPISSYIRIVEALFLYEKGDSVFSGGVFYQPPLVLLPFQVLQRVGEPATFLFFICIDLLVAFLLNRIAILHAEMALPRGYRIEKVSDKLQSTSALPLSIAAVYLFNPFTVLSCVAMSTTSITHLLVTAALFFAISSRPILTGFAFAASIYFDVYPLLLFPALVLLLHLRNNPANTAPFKLGKLTYLFTLSSLAWTAILLWLSYDFNGRNWDFLENSYGFIFSVTDLTPNIGVFWYFMTEIFDRFRTFFLFCFHGHIIAYVIPLVLRFWPNPLYLAYLLIAIPSIFKSYPVLSDISFSITLLLLQWRFLAQMRRILLVYVTLAVACTLGQVMWHLWIVAGSGNGNFFYFQTILLNFTQSFIVLETVVAVRKLYFAMEENKI